MRGAGGDPPFRPRRRRPGQDHGPRRLGDALDEVLTGAASRRGPSSSPADPPGGSMAAVFSRWEEIAGPALARHTRPLRLSGGVLVVAVDHPAWATQLRALGGGLLARVGEVAGAVPDRLQVTVRPLP